MVKYVVTNRSNVEWAKRMLDDYEGRVKMFDNLTDSVGYHYDNDEEMAMKTAVILWKTLNLVINSIEEQDLIEFPKFNEEDIKKWRAEEEYYAEALGIN